jgi:hypothetical protein
MGQHEDNENEVERASKKIFKDEPLLGIQDEYFDEPNFKNGTQPDKKVDKLLNEVAELTEKHGDAYFDPRGV